MNELDTFETLRPNVRPLSPEQQATMRSQLFGDSAHVATNVFDDAILNDDHIVRVTAQRGIRARRPILLTVAAASVLAVGAVGLIWAQRTEPGPAATADGRQAFVPASFPRLQFPVTESVTDPVLVGAQDYPIDGGWFSFANYDQEIDWNFDGNPTREPAFSVAIFTGTQADADRAICGSPDQVVQGERTITILDRTQDVWRFVWSETSGVLVVVDTYFKSREEAIAAIETLLPVREDVWQQRLASIPEPEVVTDSTDRDAIWTSYVGAANTDYQLDPTPTTSPGRNNC